MNNPKQKLYDVIHIAKTSNNFYIVSVAYDQSNNDTTPKYSHTNTYASLEELHKYLDLVFEMLRNDWSSKEDTIELQPSGFPNIMRKRSDELSYTPSLRKIVEQSMQFKRL